MYGSFLSSRLILLIIPSIEYKAPNITPDWIFVFVFFEIIFFGNVKVVFFNNAAFLIRYSAEISIPGEIAPPINSWLSFITSYVVAVPKSITKEFFLVISIAPLTLHILSEPTSDFELTSSFILQFL